jgi:hypothetical protein
MSGPEPDELFCARLLRVVAELDRPMTLVGVGLQLDRIGRRHDRFRTGVPLEGVGDDGCRSLLSQWLLLGQMAGTEVRIGRRGYGRRAFKMRPDTTPPPG